MSEAVWGKGSNFLRGDGASVEIFTSLGEVVSITQSGAEKGQIRVTHLNSPGGYHEYIPGFRDGGQYDLVMNYTRDAYDILKVDFESDDNWNYRVILSDPDATTLTFEGSVISIPFVVELEDRIVLNVTVKVSGVQDMSS